MRHTPLGLGFSATDLSAFLECRHRTTLDLRVLRGELERPGQNEIERRLLELRGHEHERRVLEFYRGSGKSVVTISAAPGSEGARVAERATLEAMQAGAEIIYQGALSHDGWSGRPDFLIRALGPRAPGQHFEHHYEVVDAKLSREAKARAVLQLCVYTDHLALLQGRTPRHFHIAPGGAELTPIALLAEDFLAYYRSVRSRFSGFVGQEGAATYPEPVEYCGVCQFWKRCENRRRDDDHLSLVAGINRRQRDRLSAAGVTRLANLAVLDRDTAVAGIGSDSLSRVREQARLQLAGRQQGKALYELFVEGEPGTGLEALPEPTPGDLFLDLEGDSFYRSEGLEYLFGLLDFGEPVFDFSSRDAPGPARYHGFWAADRASEKRAFEAVIDRIKRGREEFRLLHVYHFGHRESDALKKLSCLHATREAEVDELLRDHVLVDLHPIVRHALRASVESYTLKELEKLHGFERKTELRAAAAAMQLFGFWLETSDPELDPAELRQRIERYNEEDVLSTSRLRDWLEARRTELTKLRGKKLARPSQDPERKDTKQDEKRDATARLAKRLTAGLGDARESDDARARSRRLLAELLDWHWREAKSGYWEYHRARELAPDDRLEDRAILAGLRYEGVVGKIKLSPVHRYAFPEQEHAIRGKPTPIDAATLLPAGEVVRIGSLHIELKRGPKSTVPHPEALLPGKPIDTDAHQQSLLALGEAIAADDAGSDLPGGRALLSRRAPGAGQPLLEPGESVESGLQRLSLALDGGVLAVQGPPGSGKTHQAALMIGALLRAGKKVGVTAGSHAVIKNVLCKVAEVVPGGLVRALHLEDDDDDDGPRLPFEIHNDKAKARKQLQDGALNLIGGTAWTWASERFAQSLDVLVIDEAGQMSLANALAVSRAATSLVLFGDPAQLEQPQKGVHPPGADLSALEHLLGPDALTMPEDRGVFLPHTRRLHPAICDFVSRVFYEGRLSPVESLGLERQCIGGGGTLSGAGLRYVPVSHRGNTNHSPEEVARVSELVGELSSSAATFTDHEGRVRTLDAKDILVVAPYNAQVAALKRELPREVRVGTVDKFQGQQAPVVIYSMTTSSADDAPRGLEFLYSLNRLNVAVSRAQALAILVKSPELTQVSCRTPRQMRLVNALCAYLEAAR